MSKKRVLSVLSIMALLIFTAGCNQDQTDVDATIRFLGNPQQIDACGWIIEVSQRQRFKPLNLEPDFEQDGLRVRISFEMQRNSFICDFSNQFREVSITSITALP
jgi:hypothetical protein